MSHPCPQCHYPALHRVEGSNMRRCAHCRSYTNTRTKKHTKESSQARFLRSALKTLELIPESKLNRDKSVKNYLSVPEYEALTLAMRFISKEVRARAIFPRALNFEGVQLWLRYGVVFGQAFIVSRRTGKVLVRYCYGVI